MQHKLFWSAEGPALGSRCSFRYSVNARQNKTACAAEDEAKGDGCFAGFTLHDYRHESTSYRSQAAGRRQDAGAALRYGRRMGGETQGLAEV
ncbi:MAG: hypothetical protein ACYC21_14140 [Eubacteriales bacterium]